MPEPTFVDPELQAELAANGFVRLRLMTAEDAAALRRSVLAMLPGPVQTTNGPNYSSSIEEDDDVRSAFHSFAAAVLVPLLHERIVGGRPCEPAAIIKPAGGGRFALHHHAPFTDDPFARVLVCWLALTDADARTSALMVIPNSHQILPHIAAPGELSYFESFREQLEEETVSVDVRAGEAVIFEQTLLHGSSPNLGTADRVALTCMMIPADSRNVVFVPRGTDRFEIFDTGSEADLPRFYRDRKIRDTWRSLGFFPNRNTPITAADFAALIAQSEKADGENNPIERIRTESRASDREPSRRGIVGRVRTLFS